MKNQVLISIVAFLLLLSGCIEPLSFTEAEKIRKEVDKQFTRMLKLAENDSADAFKTYISVDGTLVVEGIYLAPEDVSGYFFEIFKSMVHQDTKINSNFYDVLSRSQVYQEVICYPRPIDTAHGIILAPAPIKLYYLTEADAGMKKALDKEVGTAVYVIPGADSSKLATLGFRLPPIKMLAFSVIMELKGDKWILRKGHLSLGLKKSKIYKLKEQRLEY